jgi:gliding motility-associated-like protein
MKKSKKILIPFLFLLVALAPAAKAQVDTLFWFAAPWVSPDHADNKPMAFRISTFGQATTVRIQQPASTYDTTFTVAANSLFSKFITHLHVLFNQVETKPANTVKQTGFKITSDFPITVVYDFLSTGNNPETYCLTGQNGMGTEFVTPFQTLWNNVTLGDNNGDGVAENPFAMFAIVATEDNTTVWIKPHCDVKGGHPANVTYSVTLNKGETYLVENNSRFSSSTVTNLSGSIVVSDKPVSVTVSDDSVNPAGGGGCYDLMGEQIVPTDVIGKEYILNKGFLNAGSNESMFIVATQNFTTINVDDGVTTATRLLNQGETYQFSITQPLTHVIADKNVYVIHASGYGCELGEALLPPLNCSGSDRVSFTRTASAAGASFFLNVLCKAGDEGNFTLNGSTTLLPASVFSPVPGTGGAWMGAQKQFTTAEVPLFAASSLSNSTGLFSMGVIDGTTSGGCLYHYMSSFLRRVYTTAGPDQVLCSGLSPVNLAGSVTGGATTGIWTLLNGTGTIGDSSVFNTTYQPTVSDTSQGSVIFVLASTGNCDPVTDTMQVIFQPNPSADAGLDQIRCENNIGTITLSGSITNAVGSNWTSTGTGGSFNNPGSLTTTYTPSASEIAGDSVSLVLTTAGNIFGCPDVSDTLKLYFTAAPVVNAGSNATVCANNAVVNLNGLVNGAPSNGIWSTNGSGLLNPADTVLSGATYTPSNSDTAQGVVVIKLTSTNNGTCNAVVDSITITIVDAPSIDITTNDTLCGNINSINLGANVTSGFPVDWNTSGSGTFTNPNTVSTVYNINPLDTANGSVDLILTTVPGICNSVSDTLHLVFADPPYANAGVDQAFCSNEVIPLNGVVSGVTTTGVWTSTGTGSFNPGPNQLATTYVPSSSDVGTTISLILTTTNNQGCNVATDTLSATFKEPPVANFTANEVCLNDPTSFTDASSAPAGETISGWNWNFGDFSPIGIAQNPIHPYNASGTFTVTLVATASNGCSDTTQQTVRVNVIPVPDFTFSIACQGNVTSFLDQSVITQGSIISWDYAFGDGSANSSTQNPTHVYTNYGSFPVTLAATSDKGCQSIVTHNINVLPQPQAYFGFSSNPALAGENITFNDISVGGPVSWNWNFGDSTGTNVQNPGHIYASGGVYNVILTIADQYGCTDSTMRELVVAMLPVLPTAFTPNGDLENDIFYVRGGPFKNLLLKVYNNWGELIFTTDKQEEGWDGKHKGIEQPMGVYVWYVEVEVADGRIFRKSGDVTLIR